MLILVPILAGLWPTVRFSVNQYNRIAKDAADRMSSVADRLHALASLTENKIPASSNSSEGVGTSRPALNHSLDGRIRETVEKLDREVSQILQDARPALISSPSLPRSWAFGFFAAVCVVIAQCLFQGLAPDTIKKSSQHEFIESRIRQFRDLPTALSLRRALDVTDTLSKWNVSDYSKSDRDAISSAQVALSQTESIEGSKAEGYLRASDPVLYVIDLAARLEYRDALSQRGAGGLISFALYTAGLLLALAILFDQSVSVAKSAGWLVS